MHPVLKGALAALKAMRGDKAVASARVVHRERAAGYSAGAAGHSSLATTQRYIAGGAEAKRRVVALV
jgi:hypothetical protein